MKKYKDITNFFMIVVLLSLILRFCFVLVHYNHECALDDNCPICSLIHKFKSDLAGFNPDLIKQVIATLLTFPPVVIYLSDKTKDKKKETLVGLKVELLN